MDMSLSKLQETVEDKEAWGAAVHEFAKNQTWLNSNNNNNQNKELRSHLLWSN